VLPISLFFTLDQFNATGNPLLLVDWKALLLAAALFFCYEKSKMASGVFYRHFCCGRCFVSFWQLI
jgi:hypothetical protein